MEAGQMFRPRKRVLGTALIVLLTIVVVAACSATGGKKAVEAQANAGSGSSGHANTPRYTIDMITHAQPGDTFWDIIRAGASAAASKDNISYHYSNNDDPTQQAQLIQDAINSHVNGIAVTDPDPQAICPTILKAKAAGIPVVMFNAGIGNWQACGAMEYFGSDETVAGTAAGKRLAAAGKKNVLCVLQAQGQVQLEARCAGVKAGLGSEGTMTKLYVNGTDSSAELSTMSAKLAQDKNIDAVITLGAPVALVAISALQQAHSTAKLYTFDTNAAEIAKIKSGAIQFAVDQQPYLQGYEAIDSLWLYLTNADVLGGDQTVLTGPSFIDSSNVATISKYAERGTR
jgi:simple sugar transport system substrate-binding protein